jgi:hypothetical protein
MILTAMLEYRVQAALIGSYNRRPLRPGASSEFTFSSIRPVQDATLVRQEDQIGRQMKQSTKTRLRDACPATLAAAVALAFGIPADTCAATRAAQTTLNVPMPANWSPGHHGGVAALRRALHSVATRPRIPGSPAHTVNASNCGDDNVTGTLRALVAAAADGDTIDLSALHCSAVTLAQGAIPIKLDNLLIIGPGADLLAIDGAGVDRVFVHYGSGTFKVQGLTVRNGLSQVTGYNVAGGACILSGGYVTLDHSTVQGCVAHGEGAYGGGILADGLTMYTSILSGNLAQGTLLDTLTAAYGGGAFAYLGTAVLFDSTVSGNRATRDPANTQGSYDTGGGIFVDYGGYASRSTFQGNYTDGTGGGIASHAGFNLIDTTLSGNTAQSKPGGGMFVRLGSTMSIYNSTIADNVAPRGGGIYIAGTPTAVTMQSSIIATNVASSGGADIGAMSALAISGANNLVISAGPGITLPGDTLHTNPGLLPLTNNGGPTLTQSLATGSPALNAGNNIGDLSTDQRGPGFPRVSGAAADIGALEVTQAPALGAAPVPSGSAWLLGVLATLVGAIGLGTLSSRVRRAQLWRSADFAVSSHKTHRPSRSLHKCECMRGVVP